MVHRAAIGRAVAQPSAIPEPERAENPEPVHVEEVLHRARLIPRDIHRRRSAEAGSRAGLVFGAESAEAEQPTCSSRAQNVSIPLAAPFLRSTQAARRHAVTGSRPWSHGFVSYHSAGVHGVGASSDRRSRLLRGFHDVCLRKVRASTACGRSPRTCRSAPRAGPRGPAGRGRATPPRSRCRWPRSSRRGRGGRRRRARRRSNR